MRLFIRTSLPLFFTAFCCLVPVVASAKSVKDFEAMPTHDQSEYVVSYLEKMTYDIGKVNPTLAKQIKNYFVVTKTGVEFPDGIEKFEVELGVLDSLAKEGKADLSDIQVESVIVWVVKQKFPPEKNQPPQQK